MWDWFKNRDIEKGKALSIFDSPYRNRGLFNGEFCKEIPLHNSNNFISIAKLAAVVSKVKTVLHIIFQWAWPPQLYSSPGVEGVDGLFPCPWEIDHRLQIERFLLCSEVIILNDKQTVFNNEVMDNELMYWNKSEPPYVQPDGYA